MQYTKYFEHPKPTNFQPYSAQRRKAERQNNNIFLAFNRSGKILRYGGSGVSYCVYSIVKKITKNWYFYSKEQKSIKSKRAYNKSPTRENIWPAKTMHIVLSCRNIPSTVSRLFTQ